ncbi:hypothetical protein EV127DRAFT_414929 [Xylaria flabelliformis]|nr:hypothetical protein EV127DRAFT_414929 [Xylaria flabelliformis]
MFDQLLAQKAPVNQESTGIFFTRDPTLSLHLPLTLKLYSQYSVGDATEFYFCGESVDDRLYAITALPNDTGPNYSMQSLYLHNSPSHRSRVIAAIGESLSFRHIDPDSDITLFDGILRWTSVRMRTTEKGKVAFSFEVEVEVNSGTRKDVFSWIRVAKNDDEAGLENGGYKLVRHPPKPRQSPDETADDTFWPGHDMSNEGQVVAILSYAKRHLLQLPLNSWRHKCTLQFTHEDVLRQLGVDLRRVILIMAVRLRFLESKGRLSSCVRAPDSG